MLVASRGERGFTRLAEHVGVLRIVAQCVLVAAQRILRLSGFHEILRSQAVIARLGALLVRLLEPETFDDFGLAAWWAVETVSTVGYGDIVPSTTQGRIVGTVQLLLAQPENQPHRADLAKMLVHRRARRRGLGEALLRGAEQMARDCGKTLLVLDTNEGSDAERLYARLGWVRVGTIPKFSIEPRGGFRGTTLFYREL